MVLCLLEALIKGSAATRSIAGVAAAMDTKPAPAPQKAVPRRAPPVGPEQTEAPIAAKLSGDNGDSKAEAEPDPEEAIPLDEPALKRF